jgi:hypothetical protein
MSKFLFKVGVYSDIIFISMNALKNKIRKHLDGLKKAQGYIDALQGSNYLNEKESLKIYNSLWLFWQQIGERKYSKKLDELHQAFLIQRRNILNKISSGFKI